MSKSALRLCLLICTQLAFMIHAVFAQDLALPGPYSASSRTVTVTRTNGTTFSALVYYPAASSAASAPFHPTCSPAPIITFGHGFFQPVSSYASTLSHLATHGFIVIATTSEGGLFPNHSNFASDILQCVTYAEQQNVLSGSFAFQRLDIQHVGIMGHSMGGGASILAAAVDARIDCLAAMAAADTNPSSITAAAAVAMPMLLISGTSDTIVPSATNLAHYNSAHASKAYPLISGGFHCGYEDATSIGCDSSTTLSRVEQLAITRRLVTGWMNLYLRSDQSRWSETWGPDRTADSRVEWTSDAGISIDRDSSQPLRLVQGRPSQVSVSVTNTSPRSQRVSVLGETDGGSGWLFAGQTSVELAPGTLSHLVLTVTSAIAGTAQSTELVIAARSERDGGTRSWFRVTAATFCAADFNMDELVDFFDYLDFVQSFSATLPNSDFNSDGTVDFFDYLDFVEAFSAGC